ncbi:MAG: hypothetical protein EOM92_02340 [Gammaproteobacteria bacterium]|jgi:hypothetical protein|nr:hypothetical protein [Gammaproteobacteria bacterium]
MALIFVFLRVSQDSDPLSMQYGWEISKGDIRLDYLLKHLGSARGVLNWLIGIWYSFGPFLILSIGLILLDKSPSINEKMLMISLIAISSIFIAAQLLLASRVARTLTPASVPLVLLTAGLLYKYYGYKVSLIFDGLLMRLLQSDSHE